MADVIAELRALLERSNPQRWWVEHPDEGGRIIASDKRATIIHEPPASPMNSTVRADSELIAAAVNALPALLDVAESAQAALPALERMDTLRHIAPEFDELDNLRAALARLVGRA